MLFALFFKLRASLPAMLKRSSSKASGPFMANSLMVLAPVSVMELKRLSMKFSLAPRSMPSTKRSIKSVIRWLSGAWSLQVISPSGPSIQVCMLCWIRAWAELLTMMLSPAGGSKILPIIEYSGVILVILSRILLIRALSRTSSQKPGPSLI